MKKSLLGLIVFLSLLTLTSCRNKVTTKELMANEWAVNSNVDEVVMIVSFSEDTATFKINTDEHTSTAKNELEKAGEELGKQIANKIEYKVKYHLKNNQIRWENEGKEVAYKIKKEKQNLLFTPTKTNNSDNQTKLVLKPYTKKSIDSSTQKDKTEETSSNYQNVSSETNQSTSSSTTKEPLPQVSLADFIGGWGIPQSDNLFFINADGTLTSITQSNVPLQNVSFSVDENGNQTMTFLLNNTPRPVTNNNDGTLTVNGQIYTYLGNITLEQLIERNNQTQQVFEQSEQQPPQNSDSSEQIQNSKSDQPIYDTVRSGEGGRQLAERNGLTLEELLALNPGIETSVFYPGQSLRIK